MVDDRDNEAPKILEKAIGIQCWAPVSDLPGNWRELASSDLQSLSKIWSEQSERLKESDSLKQFNVRLRRQWAIETGIIENLYTIDRGVTQLLIEKGIVASLISHGSADQPAEHIVNIIRDQQSVLDGLFDFVAQTRELTTSYIKEIHSALTIHQRTVRAVNGLGTLVEVPMNRGQWKMQPNNPSRRDGSTHEYCPPVHVASEMDELIAMHQKHMKINVPPEIEASWLHHRFTQIHPFQDGNGRVARALASLVFLRFGWFPLVIQREIREDYIMALEEADNGSLKGLVMLFAEIQKKAFVKALSISETVLHDDDQVSQVIASALERLKAREYEHSQERQRVFDISGMLEDITLDKLNEIRSSLLADLRVFGRRYRIDTNRSTETTDHWFKAQIIKMANELDYYADTRTYHKWVRLKIVEERQVELVISFHSLGVDFLGIMAVSSFILFRDRQEGGTVALDGPYRICDTVFQFYYNEDEEVVIDRFQIWLQKAILLGLDQWRRQL